MKEGKSSRIPESLNPEISLMAFRGTGHPGPSRAHTVPSLKLPHPLEAALFVFHQSRSRITAALLQPPVLAVLAQDLALNYLHPPPPHQLPPLQRTRCALGATYWDIRTRRPHCFKKKKMSRSGHLSEIVFHIYRESVICNAPAGSKDIGGQAQSLNFWWRTAVNRQNITHNLRT